MDSRPSCAVTSTPPRGPAWSQIRLPVRKSTASRPSGAWARIVPPTASGAAAGHWAVPWSANSRRIRSSRRLSSGCRVSGTRYRGTSSGREATARALRPASPRGCRHSASPVGRPALPPSSRSHSSPRPWGYEIATSRPAIRAVPRPPARARSRMAAAAVASPARSRAQARMKATDAAIAASPSASRSSQAVAASDCPDSSASTAASSAARCPAGVANQRRATATIAAESSAAIASASSRSARARNWSS